MENGGWLALYYLSGQAGKELLEEPVQPYGLAWDEYQAQELAAFVRLASEELKKRQIAPATLPAGPDVRVTADLRVYIGPRELQLRPLSKAILLLFLRHPEGIPIKDISDYREELAGYYRRVSRSSDTTLIEQRIRRIINVFEGDITVQISRVNAAVSRLVDGPAQGFYKITGRPGTPKRIPLERSHVVWESTTSPR